MKLTFVICLLLTTSAFAESDFFGSQKMIESCKNELDISTALRMALADDNKLDLLEKEKPSEFLKWNPVFKSNFVDSSSLNIKTNKQKECLAFVNGVVVGIFIESIGSLNDALNFSK